MQKPGPTNTLVVTTKFPGGKQGSIVYTIEFWEGKTLCQKLIGPMANRLKTCANFDLGKARAPQIITTMEKTCSNT